MALDSHDSLLSCTHRHCPDSRRTFTKRLMLEKHIQLMHGIKDPDVKELSDDVTNEEEEEEEVEIKEDAKVRHLSSALLLSPVLTSVPCSLSVAFCVVIASVRSCQVLQ